jgi:hypothetical protein
MVRREGSTQSEVRKVIECLGVGKRAGVQAVMKLMERGTPLTDSEIKNVCGKAAHARDFDVEGLGALKGLQDHLRGYLDRNHKRPRRQQSNVGFCVSIGRQMVPQTIYCWPERTRNIANEGDTAPSQELRVCVHSG